MTATAPTSQAPASTHAAQGRAAQAATAGSGQPEGDAFAALLNDLFADLGEPLQADAAAAGGGLADDPAGAASAGSESADPQAFLANPFVPPGPALPHAAATATTRRFGAAGGEAEGETSASALPASGQARGGAANTFAALSRGVRPQAATGLQEPGGAQAGAPTAASTPAGAEPFAAALAQAAAPRAAGTPTGAAPQLSLEGLAGVQHGGRPEATAEAAPVHEAALHAQPLDGAFPGELAAEVKVMLEGGLQSAELHLNPEELGPIRIHLSLEGDQAELSFAAAHATTREGIEQALPELRALLAEQGLNLAHTGVSSGSQQGFAQGREPQAQAQAAATPHGGAAGDGAPAAVQQATVGANRGLLDLYA